MGAGWREAWSAQEGQGFLWTPVALVAGIWCYFALPVEPHPLVFAGLLIAAVGLAAAGRRNIGALAVALVLSGVCLAKARTEWVRAPVIAAATGMVDVAGTVERIQRKGRRGAIVLAVDKVGGMAAADAPRRLRLTVFRDGLALKPGQAIEAKALLHVLPTPAAPGAYDYGRALWFDGIGGTGRITGDLRVVATRATVAGWLDELRSAIGGRIRAVLPGATGAFGEAIVTGERGTIPAAVNESLQVSGLAHILSISGLHMTLVAGSVFWLVRAMLALVPSLALAFPIKKWAAGAALAAGFFYMLLAGSDVATQRSYIMLAVMFFAVLVDRPALSMRNLAVAALIVIVLQPEAVLTAGFQMSFMAVMGLVALHGLWFEWRKSRWERTESYGPLRKAFQWALLAVAAMALTSLAAGLFSSIPAAYHFGRLSPLSLLANLLALPVVSFVVMPAALLSVVLMPLGLEAGALWLMGEGLRVVLSISDWVAALPVARTAIPSQPLPSVLMLAAAALALCLWRGRWRLASLPVAAAGLALGFLQAPPDILVERTAANVALRGESGELSFADGRRARFAASRWLAANGEDLGLSTAAARRGWTCADGICRATVKGRAVAYLREGADASALCASLDILIAAYPLRGACRRVPLRIDRFDVWRHGAHALYLSDTIIVKTARGEQGQRPWTVTPRPRAKLAATERVPGRLSKP